MATRAKEFAKKTAIVLAVAGAAAGILMGFGVIPAIAIAAHHAGFLGLHFATLHAGAAGALAAAKLGAIGIGVGAIGGGILGAIGGLPFKKKDIIPGTDSSQELMSRSRQKELMPEIVHEHFHEAEPETFQHRNRIEASRAGDLPAGRSA